MFLRGRGSSCAPVRQTLVFCPTVESILTCTIRAFNSQKALRDVSQEFVYKIVYFDARNENVG